MYMGAKIILLLTTPEYKQHSVEVRYFLEKVQEFYIEAACQVKRRFPIGDPMIEMFEVLDPNTSHSKFPSKAASFPNLIPDSKLQ